MNIFITCLNFPVKKCLQNIIFHTKLVWFVSYLENCWVMHNTFLKFFSQRKVTVKAYPVEKTAEEIIEGNLFF